MKTLHLAVLLSFVLCACGDPRPKLKDSQGRVFIRVREAKPVAKDIVDAELWQQEGKLGPEHPFYIKLLQADSSQPPFFTQTQ